MNKFDCIAAFGCSFVHGDAINKGQDLRHTNEPTDFAGDKYRFSKILADHYNIPEVNMAGSGYSNESILRSIYKFFDNNSKTYKTPLVLIGTSGLARKEVYSKHHECFFNVHQLEDFYHTDSNEKAARDMALKLTGNKNNTDKLKNFVNFNMKYFFDNQLEVEKLDWQLTFLIGFLNNKNIPYIIFNSIEDIISEKIKQSSNYLSFGYKTAKNYELKKEGGYHINSDCWYTDIYTKHIKKYGSWESGSRSMYKPYGEFASGGHPSPGSHKNLANKILKYIDENNI